MLQALGRRIIHSKITVAVELLLNLVYYGSNLKFMLKELIV